MSRDFSFGFLWSAGPPSSMPRLGTTSDPFWVGYLETRPPDAELFSTSEAQHDSGGAAARQRAIALDRIDREGSFGTPVSILRSGTFWCVSREGKIEK